MCKRVLLVLLLLATFPLLAATPEVDKLNELIAEDWQWQLRDNPENATYLGERGHDDRHYGKPYKKNYKKSFLSELFD